MATFREQFSVARKSLTAWEQFIGALTPGADMDLAVTWAVTGSWLKKPKACYSHAGDFSALQLALKSCDYVSVIQSGDDSLPSDPPYWVSLEWTMDGTNYSGDGRAKTLELAVCRALLEMWSPCREELDDPTELDPKPFTGWVKRPGTPAGVVLAAGPFSFLVKDRTL